MRAAAFAAALFMFGSVYEQGNTFQAGFYNRTGTIQDWGAENVHLTYFPRVLDKSGLYKMESGAPYEYDGHWSWIYTYNNDVFAEINREGTSLMGWMAQQVR